MLFTASFVAGDFRWNHHVELQQFPVINVVASGSSFTEIEVMVKGVVNTFETITRNDDGKLRDPPARGEGFHGRSSSSETTCKLQ